jgi:amphi-Trp domain-containing protein|tara:strand:- start:577 stop:816 length:240 start_codon:yes stop_codon:yes gene_type:complete
MVANKAKTKKKRDLEKAYTPKQLAAKLRRFADSLETGKQFRIQIAGERVLVPKNALCTIEHERGGGEEEIEFQIKWPLS